MEKHDTASLEPFEDHAGIAFAPAPELDPVDYLPEMDGFDMTEAQKVELLTTLWDIMRRFVEMGVDIGEADPCGQIFGAADEFPAAASDGVKSSFSTATETRTHKKEDGPA